MDVLLVLDENGEYYVILVKGSLRSSRFKLKHHWDSLVLPRQGFFDPALRLMCAWTCLS